VFDNAEEPKDLKEYLPQSNGAVIVTSRNPNWRVLAEPMEVQELPPEEAADFLVERSGDKDRGTALRLAEELGSLPLALEQAGAYIEACGSSCVKYLDLFREHHQKLLKQGKPLDYPDTVATTWRISFGSLRKECPAAAELMELCAFFAPEAIPFSLFTEHPEHLPRSLKAAVKNPLGWDEAIRWLNRYSLAEVAQDSLSFHRLVQMVVRNGMKPAARKSKVTAAVAGLNEAYDFKPYDLDTWPSAVELLPHSLAAVEHSHNEQVDDKPAAQLLNRMGWHLRVLGKFAEGKSLLLRALRIAEKFDELDGAMGCAILNSLASLLQDLGEFKAAKDIFEKALKIAKRVYGADHPDVATSLSNLGLVLLDLGDLEGAKANFERALRIGEEVYGPDHPAVATRLNNLGLVLKDLGDLEGAKANYERALKIDEKVYGPDHPKIGIRLNNLGSVLKDLGDLQGAKANFEKALSIDEKVYGPDHPAVATDLNNLGLVLRDLGDLEGAKGNFERALKIGEKVYGRDHPTVASCLNNLGGVLHHLGDLEGAKANCERALAILRARLGDDHPKTKLVLKNLKSLESRK